MQIASTKNEHAESGVTGKTMAALLATCARVGPIYLSRGARKPATVR